MALKKDPTTQKPVAGVQVVIGAHEYTVPPISLYHVRMYADQLKSLDASKQMDVGSIDLIAQVALAALKRNYPELTLDELAQEIDFGNIMSVYQAVMGVSGFVSGAPAVEGTKSGELTGRS